MTVKELCVQLGISKPHCVRMVREGRIPGVLHLGRRVIISRKAVEEWLARGEGKPDTY